MLYCGVCSDLYKNRIRATASQTYNLFTIFATYVLNTNDVWAVLFRWNTPDAPNLGLGPYACLQVPLNFETSFNSVSIPLIFN